MKCRVCGAEADLYDEMKDNPVDVTGFFKEPVSGKKTDIKGYRCNCCGHIQTEFTLNDLYYEDYNLIYNPQSDAVSSYPEKLMRYYQSCFEKLRAMSEHGRSVLDVGCAAGDMLLMLSKHFEQCFGIEPSEKLSAVAVGRGLQVVNDYFGKHTAFGLAFDCITCLMVLEHIENLQEFMSDLYENLVDGGMVLINVPNGQRILDTSAYVDFFPEHINYFTPRSLTELAYRSGFELVCLEEGFGAGYHLTAWLRKPGALVLFSEKKARDISTLQRVVSGYNNIGIFGMGVRARNILHLLGCSKCSIKYLFDNNEVLSNQYIPDFKQQIQKPQRETVNECDLILITSVEYYDEIIAELQDKHQYAGTIVYLKDGIYTEIK